MIDLKNPKALEVDARRAKGLGFGGKLCIHPNQLEVVHRVFSPSPDEVEQARKIVKAFDDASAAGQAALQVDGIFVDPPVVERAKRIMALAAAQGQAPG
jgi:citrate lyase subunit beta/citryl-CoA lyase